MKKTKRSWTIHPGEILKTEFMEPMNISTYRLAKDLDFPGIYDVIGGKRSISAETALRLGKYFGLPAQFWMNLQTEHDLRVAAATAKLERVKIRTAA
jgi:antitoxin HigA-1